MNGDKYFTGQGTGLVFNSQAYMQYFAGQSGEDITLRLRSTTPQTIVDIGANNGALLHSMQNLFPQHRYIGIDPHCYQDALIPITEDDAQSLETVEDNSIDLIVSARTFAHLDDKLKGMHNVQRVLKNDGQAHIHLPTGLITPSDVHCELYDLYASSPQTIILNKNSDIPEGWSLEGTQYNHIGNVISNYKKTL